MIILWILLGSLAFLLLFFYLYILVMGIYRAYLNKKFAGRPFVFSLCIPAILLGLIVDFTANITYATIVFLELPRECLVTTRLSRIMYDPNESVERIQLATFICHSMLDIFDPSEDHCKRK